MSLLNRKKILTSQKTNPQVFHFWKNTRCKICYQQKAHPLSSKHLFLNLSCRIKYRLILCSATICCQFLSAAKVVLDLKGSMQIPGANGTQFYVQKGFTVLCRHLISTCSYLRYIQISNGTCLNFVWYIHPVHLWKVLEKSKVQPATRRKC